MGSGFHPSVSNSFAELKLSNTTVFGKRGKQRGKQSSAVNSPSLRMQDRPIGTAWSPRDGCTGKQKDMQSQLLWQRHPRQLYAAAAESDCPAPC